MVLVVVGQHVVKEIELLIEQVVDEQLEDGDDEEAFDVVEVNELNWFREVELLALELAMGECCRRCAWCCCVRWCRKSVAASSSTSSWPLMIIRDLNCSAPAAVRV